MALAGVSLLPAFYGVAGSVYVAGALVAGLLFVGCAIRFGSGRIRKPAAKLMAASLVYMPLILALLIFDKKTF
jgi:protoheme IX farnesyltransferase